MAQPQPAFGGRGAPHARIPDRTIPSGSQQQFGQSAPGFNRQPQFQQQLPQQQQQQYGNFSQYNAGPAYGQGRAQLQPPVGAIGGGTEKESNAMNDMTQEQKEEIEEAFRLFDLDKDHHLDYHEFRVALRALGFMADKPELSQLIQQYGVPKRSAQRPQGGNRAPPMNYHPSELLMPHADFTRIAAQKISERDPLVEVGRAYQLFDLEGKGFISLDDLRRIAAELGENMLEEQELQTMIDEFDYEGQGGVSREAFFSICMQ